MRDHRHRLALHIFIIIILVVGITYGFISWPLYIPIILILLLFVLAIKIIQFQTSIYERINFFFEAIINDDFSSTRRYSAKDEILSRLNKNMDKVNQKIRRNMEENQQQESYFRTLIEHLNIGVLTFNANGFVIHANKTLLNYFGMEHLSHIKQFIKHDPKLFDLVEQMKVEQTQQVYSYNNTVRKYNLLLKATPYTSNRETLTIITVQDIDQQLDEKELDSWIKLIRVLTHEIMNGIAPITSLSDSILDLYVQEDNNIPLDQLTSSDVDITIKGLNVISEQAERLTRFVESYRKITRLPKPVKAPIKIKPYLEKIVLMSKAGSYFVNVNVELNLADVRSELLADEKLLTQVLLNILKNSMEALKETEAPLISIDVKNSENNNAEIAIENNGPQIPKDVINDIFIPFFTTKENGSGVGLSISRQIIRLHGGVIKVTSTAEKTRFVFNLPG